RHERQRVGCVAGNRSRPCGRHGVAGLWIGEERTGDVDRYSALVGRRALQDLTGRAAREVDPDRRAVRDDAVTGWIGETDRELVRPLLLELTARVASRAR